MEYNNLELALQDLGFDSDESRIYIYYLKTKKVNISKMCIEFGINRMKAYAIISRLIEENLLVKTGAMNTAITANSPYLLIEKLKQKKESFNTKIDSLTQLLPTILNQFYGSSQLPELKFYKGKEAFKILLNDALDQMPEAGEFMVLFENNKTIDMLGLEFIRAWIKKRNKRKIDVRVVATNQNGYKLQKTIQQDYFGTVKFLDIDDDDLGTLTLINNKVIYWNTTKEEAVVIESIEIFNFFKTVFNLIWTTI
jgi:sugar-specific transcriptional regulator TrmB